MKLACQGVAVFSHIVGPELFQSLVSSFIHLGALLLSVELAYFVFCTPAPSDIPLKPYRIETYLGTVAYTAAYAFSLLRLPFSLIPYLTKLCFFIIFKSRYKSLWNSYLFQSLGVLGDFVNLAVTPFLIVVIFGVARNDLVF